MREKVKKERREKIKKGVSAGLMFLAMALMLLNPVAAANETSPSINWTAIGDIIEGAGSIMPSVGELITAVVPVILLLIVVGFVTGLFDSIIGAISDAFRFFRR